MSNDFNLVISLIALHLTYNCDRVVVASCAGIRSSCWRSPDSGGGTRTVMAGGVVVKSYGAINVGVGGGWQSSQ
jgi:hypothetical protein